jgi:T5SS/PEP-CTERM-associated repeat protein
VTVGRGGKAQALIDGPGSEATIVSGTVGGAFFHVGWIADSNAGALDGELTVSNGGKLLVEGNGSDSTFTGFQVARDPGATGLLTIDGGEVELRTGAGGDGTIEVNGLGSTFDVTGEDTGIFIGDNETGTMRVLNGGEVRTADLHVGSSVGSVGTLTVDAGSTIELSGRDASENRGPIMFVGGRGAGVANVHGGVSIGGNAGDTNGGNVSNFAFVSAGRNAGTFREVIVDDGVMEISGISHADVGPSLWVGRAGHGALTVRNGGRIDLGNAFISDGGSLIFGDFNGKVLVGSTVDGFGTWLSMARPLSSASARADC